MLNECICVFLNPYETYKESSVILHKANLKSTMFQFGMNLNFNMNNTAMLILTAFDSISAFSPTLSSGPRRKVIRRNRCISAHCNNNNNSEQNSLIR